MPDRRGLGAGEVLVATALLLLLVATVVSLYSRSYQAVERGANRVDLIRRARFCWNVVSQTLRNASPSEPGLPAIESPRVGDEPGDSVVFSSAEDLFTGGRGESRRYRLVSVPDEAGGSIVLESLQDDSRRVLVEEVRACRFSRPDPGCVRLEIEVAGAQERSFHCNGIVVLPDYVAQP
ncbi:MAG: hypothetical protein AB7S38_20845 [Vulcanimicrobiota bacterium]